MSHNPLGSPWHAESFNRFINEQLPELISARIPIESYAVDTQEGNICSIAIAISSSRDDHGLIHAEITEIPCPDSQGVFHLDKREWVVVPLASCEDLSRATVQCVGDLLMEYVDPRLGEAPPDLDWNEGLIRSWLPVAKWVREFLLDTKSLGTTGYTGAQSLDTQNWISRHEHLRRVLIPNREKIVSEGQLGRMCPIQTPEGPNIGRVAALARGARISGNTIEITNASPVDKLSLTAALIPFLEYNEPARSLMGANMMRQWVVQDEPEPAWVQTGYETNEPRFWNGRNLLTAFISLGEDTFYDGIVISESASKRFCFEGLIEPGDKFSNRHGTKGVISRILPDDEMPHLSDGTPVELVCSFIGQHTCMNFGQIREAVFSRIAEKEGQPIISPPFQGLDNEAIRDHLTRSGLPKTGMETLRPNQNGSAFPRPSVVGYVYWGLTIHLVGKKIVNGSKRPQRQGQLEYYALRDLDAYKIISDTYNTGSSFRDDSDTLLDRISQGDINDADAPTPAFRQLQANLAAVGISADLNNNKVRFSFSDNGSDAIELACPVQHPWLPNRELHRIGRMPDCPGFELFIQTNTQMKRMLNGRAPDRLKARSRENLQKRVDQLFSEILMPRQLRPETRVVLSARTILAPGKDLRHDQVGLPDTVAWYLFGPLVARETGRQAVENRTDHAVEILDRIMAEKWVIVNRAPTVSPTALLGFHPVRINEKVIRLHLMACQLMNADFDGDQVAVILPVTDAAQQETQEKLSIMGHLNRDVSLLDLLCPTHESMWGLAALNLTPDGRDMLRNTVGEDMSGDDELLVRFMIQRVMQGILQNHGPDNAMAILDQLWKAGFKCAGKSGASINPLVEPVHVNIPFQSDATDALNCLERLTDQVMIRRDFNAHADGVQVLAVLSEARGNPDMIVRGFQGWVFQAVSGEWMGVDRGFIQGLEPDDLFQCAFTAREKLGKICNKYVEMGQSIWNSASPRGFNVLARAARLKSPGPVLARAAAIEEVDPLTDLDSQLFVGIPAGDVHPIA